MHVLNKLYLGLQKEAIKMLHAFEAYERDTTIFLRTQKRVSWTNVPSSMRSIHHGFTNPTRTFSMDCYKPSQWTVITGYNMLSK